MLGYKIDHGEISWGVTFLPIWLVLATLASMTLMWMACCIAWSTPPSGAVTAGFRLIVAQMVLNWPMYDANDSSESSRAFLFAVMKFLKFYALCTCSLCGTLKMVDMHRRIS